MTSKRVGKVKAWAVKNKDANCYQPMFFWTVYFEKSRAEYHIRDVNSDELEIIEVEIKPIQPKRGRGK